jgi:hypothetical protein
MGLGYVLLKRLQRERRRRRRSRHALVPGKSPFPVSACLLCYSCEDAMSSAIHVTMQIIHAGLIVMLMLISQKLNLGLNFNVDFFFILVYLTTFAFELLRTRI